MSKSLEEQMAELAVCCKSCTNRLDKLERWSEGISNYIDAQNDNLVPCPDCGESEYDMDAKGRYKCAGCGALQS